MARPRLDEEERRAQTVGVRATAAEAAELRERAQAARRLVCRKVPFRAVHTARMPRFGAWCDAIERYQMIYKLTG